MTNRAQRLPALRWGEYWVVGQVMAAMAWLLEMALLRSIQRGAN